MTLRKKTWIYVFISLLILISTIESQRQSRRRSRVTTRKSPSVVANAKAIAKRQVLIEMRENLAESLHTDKVKVFVLPNGKPRLVKGRSAIQRMSRRYETMAPVRVRRLMNLLEVRIRRADKLLDAPSARERRIGKPPQPTTTAASTTTQRVPQPPAPVERNIQQFTGLVPSTIGKRDKMSTITNEQNTRNIVQSSSRVAANTRYRPITNQRNEVAQRWLNNGRLRAPHRSGGRMSVPLRAETVDHGRFSVSDIRRPTLHRPTASAIQHSHLRSRISAPSVSHSIEERMRYSPHTFRSSESFGGRIDPSQRWRHPTHSIRHSNTFRPGTSPDLSRLNVQKSNVSNVLQTNRDKQSPTWTEQHLRNRAPNAPFREFLMFPAHASVQPTSETVSDTRRKVLLPVDFGNAGQAKATDNIQTKVSAGEVPYDNLPVEAQVISHQTGLAISPTTFPRTVKTTTNSVKIHPFTGTALPQPENPQTDKTPSDSQSYEKPTQSIDTPAEALAHTRPQEKAISEVYSSVGLSPTESSPYVLPKPTDVLATSNMVPTVFSGKPSAILTAVTPTALGETKTATDSASTKLATLPNPTLNPAESTGLDQSALRQDATGNGLSTSTNTIGQHHSLSGQSANSRLDQTRLSVIKNMPTLQEELNAVSMKHSGQEAIPIGSVTSQLGSVNPFVNDVHRHYVSSDGISATKDKPGRDRVSANTQVVPQNPVMDELISLIQIMSAKPTTAATSAPIDVNEAMRLLKSREVQSLAKPHTTQSQVEQVIDMLRSLEAKTGVGAHKVNLHGKTVDYNPLNSLNYQQPAQAIAMDPLQHIQPIAIHPVQTVPAVALDPLQHVRPLSMNHVQTVSAVAVNPLQPVRPMSMNHRQAAQRVSLNALRPVQAMSMNHPQGAQPVSLNALRPIQAMEVDPRQRYPASVRSPHYQSAMTNIHGFVDPYYQHQQAMMMTGNPMAHMFGGFMNADAMQEMMFGDTTDAPDPVQPPETNNGVEAEDRVITTPRPTTTTSPATTTVTAPLPLNHHAQFVMRASLAEPPTSKPGSQSNKPTGWQEMKGSHLESHSPPVHDLSAQKQGKQHQDKATSLEEQSIITAPENLGPKERMSKQTQRNVDPDVLSRVEASIERALHSAELPKSVMLVLSDKKEAEQRQPTPITDKSLKRIQESIQRVLKSVGISKSVQLVKINDKNRKTVTKPSRNVIDMQTNVATDANADNEVLHGGVRFLSYAEAPAKIPIGSEKHVFVQHNVRQKQESSEPHPFDSLMIPIITTPGTDPYPLKASELPRNVELIGGMTHGVKHKPTKKEPEWVEIPESNWVEIPMNLGAASQPSQSEVQHFPDHQIVEAGRRKSLQTSGGNQGSSVGHRHRSVPAKKTVIRMNKATPSMIVLTTEHVTPLSLQKNTTSPSILSKLLSVLKDSNRESLIDSLSGLLQKSLGKTDAGRPKSHVERIGRNSSPHIQSGRPPAMLSLKGPSSQLKQRQHVKGKSNRVRSPKLLLSQAPRSGLGSPPHIISNPAIHNEPIESNDRVFQKMNAMGTHTEPSYSEARSSDKGFGSVVIPPTEQLADTTKITLVQEEDATSKSTLRRKHHRVVQSSAPRLIKTKVENTFSGANMFKAKPVNPANEEGITAVETMQATHPKVSKVDYPRMNPINISTNTTIDNRTLYNQVTPDASADENIIQSSNSPFDHVPFSNFSRSAVSVSKYDVQYTQDGIAKDVYRMSVSGSSEPSIAAKILTVKPVLPITVTIPMMTDATTSASNKNGTQAVYDISQKASPSHLKRNGGTSDRYKSVSFGEVLTTSAPNSVLIGGVVDNKPHHKSSYPFKKNPTSADAAKYNVAVPNQAYPAQYSTAGFTKSTNPTPGSLYQTTPYSTTGLDAVSYSGTITHNETPNNNENRVTSATTPKTTIASSNNKQMDTASYPTSPHLYNDVSKRMDHQASSPSPVSRAMNTSVDSDIYPISPYQTNNVRALMDNKPYPASPFPFSTVADTVTPLETDIYRTSSFPQSINTNGLTSTDRRKPRTNANVDESTYTSRTDRTSVDIQSTGSYQTSPYTKSPEANVKTSVDKDFYPSSPFPLSTQTNTKAPVEFTIYPTPQSPESPGTKIVTSTSPFPLSSKTNTKAPGEFTIYPPPQSPELPGTNIFKSTSTFTLSSKRNTKTPGEFTIYPTPQSPESPGTKIVTSTSPYPLSSKTNTKAPGEFTIYPTPQSPELPGTNIFKSTWTFTLSSKRNTKTPGEFTVAPTPQSPESSGTKIVKSTSPFTLSSNKNTEAPGEFTITPTPPSPESSGTKVVKLTSPFSLSSAITIRAPIEAVTSADSNNFTPEINIRNTSGDPAYTTTSKQPEIDVTTSKDNALHPFSPTRSFRQESTANISPRLQVGVTSQVFSLSRKSPGTVSLQTSHYPTTMRTPGIYTDIDQRTYTTYATDPGFRISYKTSVPSQPKVDVKTSTDTSYQTTNYSGTRPTYLYKSNGTALNRPTFGSDQQKRDEPFAMSVNRPSPDLEDVVIRNYTAYTTSSTTENDASVYSTKSTASHVGSVTASGPLTNLVDSYTTSPTYPPADMNVSVYSGDRQSPHSSPIGEEPSLNQTPDGKDTFVLSLTFRKPTAKLMEYTAYQTPSVLNAKAAPVSEKNSQNAFNLETSEPVNPQHGVQRMRGTSKKRQSYDTSNDNISAPTKQANKLQETVLDMANDLSQQGEVTEGFSRYNNVIEVQPSRKREETNAGFTPALWSPLGTRIFGKRPLIGIPISMKLFSPGITDDFYKSKSATPKSRIFSHRVINHGQSKETIQSSRPSLSFKISGQMRSGHTTADQPAASDKTGPRILHAATAQPKIRPVPAASVKTRPRKLHAATAQPKILPSPITTHTTRTVEIFSTPDSNTTPPPTTPVPTDHTTTPPAASTTPAPTDSTKSPHAASTTPAPTDPTKSPPAGSTTPAPTDPTTPPPAGSTTPAPTDPTTPPHAGSTTPASTDPAAPPTAGSTTPAPTKRTTPPPEVPTTAAPSNPTSPLTESLHTPVPTNHTTVPRQHGAIVKSSAVKDDVVNQVWARRTRFNMRRQPTFTMPKRKGRTDVNGGTHASYQRHTTATDPKKPESDVHKQVTEALRKVTDAPNPVTDANNQVIEALNQVSDRAFHVDVPAQYIEGPNQFTASPNPVTKAGTQNTDSPYRFTTTSRRSEVPIQVTDSTNRYTKSPTQVTNSLNSANKNTISQVTDVPNNPDIHTDEAGPYLQNVGTELSSPIPASIHQQSNEDAKKYEEIRNILNDATYQNTNKGVSSENSFTEHQQNPIRNDQVDKLHMISSEMVNIPQTVQRIRTQNIAPHVSRHLSLSAPNNAFVENSPMQSTHVNTHQDSWKKTGSQQTMPFYQGQSGVQSQHALVKPDMVLNSPDRSKQNQNERIDHFSSDVFQSERGQFSMQRHAKQHNPSRQFTVTRDPSPSRVQFSADRNAQRGQTHQQDTSLSQTSSPRNSQQVHLKQHHHQQDPSLSHASSPRNSPHVHAQLHESSQIQAKHNINTPKAHPQQHDSSQIQATHNINTPKAHPQQHDSSQIQATHNINTPKAHPQQHDSSQIQATHNINTPKAHPQQHDSSQIQATHNINSKRVSSDVRRNIPKPNVLSNLPPRLIQSSPSRGLSPVNVKPGPFRIKFRPGTTPVPRSTGQELNPERNSFRKPIEFSRFDPFGSLKSQTSSVVTNRPRFTHLPLLKNIQPVHLQQGRFYQPTQRKRLAASPYMKHTKQHVTTLAPTTEPPPSVQSLLMQMVHNEAMKIIQSIIPSPVPQTTTTPTTTPAPTPKPTVATSIGTTTPTPPVSATGPCGKHSPRYKCQGRAMFASMPSIAHWCVAMCLKGKCVDSVCWCRATCDVPLSLTKEEALGSAIASALSGQTTDTNNVEMALQSLLSSLELTTGQVRPTRVTSKPITSWSINGANTIDTSKSTTASTTVQPQTTTISSVVSLLASIEKLIAAKLQSMKPSSTKSPLFDEEGERIESEDLKTTTKDTPNANQPEPTPGHHESRGQEWTRRDQQMFPRRNYMWRDRRPDPMPWEKRRPGPPDIGPTPTDMSRDPVWRDSWRDGPRGRGPAMREQPENMRWGRRGGDQWNRRKPPLREFDGGYQQEPRSRWGTTASPRYFQDTVFRERRPPRRSWGGPDRGWGGRGTTVDPISQWGESGFQRRRGRGQFYRRNFRHGGGGEAAEAAD